MQYITYLLMAIGGLAFVVAVIVQVIKELPCLNQIPTSVVALAVSMILCPLGVVIVCQCLKIVIVWYYVFASFIAAFYRISGGDRGLGSGSPASGNGRNTTENNTDQEDGRPSSFLRRRDAGERKTAMKIILTVGHSILKTGSCTSADGRPYGGVLEYAYNKNIVNRVAEYLRSVGHKVDMLICPELQFKKSTEEKTYKLQRVNSGGYDLAVELHLNASALHNARGCETLYNSEKGKKIAQQIQTRLATVFRNRGIQKRSGLYMLNSTTPTTVMLESFFCDSSADCALAAKTDVALLIAEGIHGGVINGQQGSADPAPSGMLYRVQTGAFTVWKNAERMKTELQKKGFRDAFITTVDLGQLFYRVQVGAFSVKSNAEAMKKKLQKAGFDAVIVQA